jgi:PAS domain S-box-containing protein
MPSTSSSESTLQAVLDAAFDAVIVTDQNGRVVEFNQAAEGMFGYSRTKALGQAVGELVVPPGLRAAHLAGLERVAAGGSPRILGRPVEFTALALDGREFPVALTVTQTADPSRRFVAWIRDLSDRRADEGEAARRDSLLERTERLAQTGSWALDLSSGDAVWSEGMYRIHGLERGEVEPSVPNLLARTHGEDRELVGALLRSILRDPESIPEKGLTAEYRAIRADGSVGELRVHGSIERDEQGRPTSWVCVARDITDRRLTERELQAHYALALALREWEAVDEGHIGLLRRLGTALDYPLALMWTRAPDTDLVALRAFWSAPGLDAADFHAASDRTILRPHEGMVGRVWASRQPTVMDDVRARLSPGRAEAATRLGIRSGLAFAAVGDRGTVAVLSLYSFDRRAPSDHLLHTLTGIGEELGRFLVKLPLEPGSRPLTKRELEVLGLAAAGNSGPQIAEQLTLSPATVKTHFEHIYEKLGVGDRAAAVAYALRTGVIS